jgi:hypothetical protein
MMALARHMLTHPSQKRVSGSQKKGKREGVCMEEVAGAECRRHRHLRERDFRGGTAGSGRGSGQFVRLVRTI